MMDLVSQLTGKVKDDECNGTVQYVEYTSVILWAEKSVNNELSSSVALGTSDIVREN